MSFSLFWNLGRGDDFQNELKLMSTLFFAIFAKGA